MLTITDGGSLTRALSTTIDPRLKQLLANRVRQLDVEDLSTAARFVIVQPGDTVADADQALGFCILQNPADGTRFGDAEFSPGFEWIEDHGFAFELTFEATTDFTVAVLVERGRGIDPNLLAFCATYAGEQTVS